MDPKAMICPNRPTLAVTLSATLAVAMPGCGLLEQRSQPVQPVTQTNTPPVVTIENPKESAELKKSLADIQTSNTAAQSTLTGFGAQLAGYAKDISGIRGDLAHVEASIPVTISNSMKAQFDFVLKQNNDLKLQLENSLNAHAEANAKIGNLENELTGMKGTLVGIGQRYEETKNELKAGRDAVNIRSQIDDNTMKVLQESYRTLYWTTLGMCGVIVKVVMILGYRSRQRAETRYNSESRERQHWQRMIVKLMDKNGDGKLSESDLSGGTHAESHAVHKRGLFSRLFSWV